MGFRIRDKCDREAQTNDMNSGDKTSLPEAVRARCRAVFETSVQI
jgi:hypothetical protein